MLGTLGRLVARRPFLVILTWAVLAVTCLALASTGLGGAPLFDRLTTDEPTVAGSESAEGRDRLQEAAAQGAQVSLLVRGLDLTDPAAVEQLGPELAPVQEELAAVDGVTAVISPFTVRPEDPAASGLLAADGDGFLLTVALDAELTDDAGDLAHDDVVERLEQVPADLGADVDTSVVSSGTLIGDEFVGQVQEDLVTGELVALPVALILMVIVFGGFLVAGIPLVGALVSIACGLGALLGFTYLLDISSYMVNVVTVVGLGLSVDYGLLIVSRYREELHGAIERAAATAPEQSAADRPAARHAAQRSGVGDPVVAEAVVATLASAGRTVAFSAVTIAVAVSGMLLMRPDLIRAMALSAVGVVVLAVVSAITLVPALLTLLGRRLLRPSALTHVPGLRVVARGLGADAPEVGFFSRVARFVHARPWPVLIGVLALLGLFASPLTSFEMRSSSIELLPADSPQRQFVTELGEQYPAQRTPTVQVLTEATPEQAEALAQEIDALPQVAQVDPPEPAGEYLVLDVHATTDDPGSEEASAMVADIRDVDAVAPTWVTGAAAGQKDFDDALVEALPLVAAVVIVATLVLLFLMTGSVLVPLKALVTNVLSLAASLGITVWIFIEGNLSGVLGFEPVAGLESTLVPLILTFGFGLAMDYEVFLLTRIKEYWDAGLSNDEAVERGLQRMGRIITSAAAIIIAVFAGFAAGDLLAIKQVGVAMALVVLIDATLVRLLLVPATMTLLGPWNWWAPGPLRRLHQRFSLSH